MFRIQYLVSLLAFYIRGEISADSYFIRFHKPVTALGIIAAGATDTSVPVGQIASVSRHFRVELRQFLLTLVFLAGAVLIFMYFIRFFWIALILIILAVNAFLQAFATRLDVSFASGQTASVSFLVFEKEKAVQAENVIKGMIAQRMNGVEPPPAGDMS